MALISLKISVVNYSSTVTMEFDRDALICDVCQLIQKRFPYANQKQFSEHGLFKIDENCITGHWLNEERTLEHYQLKSGDMLQYKSKLRLLRVKMLDDSIKTVQIDGSQTVTEVVKVVCAKIGLYNPEEFSLTMEENPHKQLVNTKMLDTLKKKQPICNKLNWLKTEELLCEQGVAETTVVTLRKKFFLSDKSIDQDDPVQLNLIYVQLRDAIINGTLPCTRDESVKLAALQCQILHGNHDKDRHKPGFLELHNFLPYQYAKQRGIEKLVFETHQKLFNFRDISAKLQYIQLCQSLKTYGVTFFFVKEKAQCRKKLVPCLLGITCEAIVKVDVNTKALLKTWPLTTIRRWGSTPNTFTLDFGESAYSVQTTDGEAISRLIDGYVNIITKGGPGPTEREIITKELNIHQCTDFLSCIACPEYRDSTADHLVKGRCKWYEGHNSSLEDDVSKLAMRAGYLQDMSCMRYSSKISASYEQLTGFVNQEQGTTVTQQTEQEKMKETNYYQSLTYRRQTSLPVQGSGNDKEDKMEETTYYTTPFSRIDYSRNVYQSLTYREPTSLQGSGNDKEDKMDGTNYYDLPFSRQDDSRNVYQSLTYREPTSLHESDCHCTENIYQPLDLTRLHQSQDSSTYQALIKH